MSEQTALALPDTLGKPTARLGETTTYRPQPEHYSTSIGHRIVHGHNKARGVKAWNLFLEPLDKTKAGALEVEFPDDSAAITLFVQKHGLTFPEPSYRCDVNFRVVWRKIRHTNRPGSTNVVSEIELLPQEEPVTDTIAEPTTSEQLNDTLNIKRSSITVDQKTSARFMAVVGEIADHFNVPGKGRAELWHALLEVDSLNDWHGSFDEAVDKLRLAIIDTNYAPKAKVKDFIANLFRNANRTVNFQSATGYDTYEDALAEERPSEIIAEVRDYLSKPAATPPAPSPALEAPPAGAAAASASGTPETVARAANTPSSPKKDGSTVSDAKDEIRAKYTKKLQGGKEYLEVQGRVLLFRLDHSDWALETDLIGMTEDAAVFKCTIRNADGRIIATGHGRATAAGTKNLGSRFIEKGETASIGRALALAGYGNDDTLEDSDYLADSPRAA